MSALERARTAFNRIDGKSAVADSSHLIMAVGALLNAVEAAPAPMSRLDALKAAREHVEAMATNTRGYQDGVQLPEKVASVERFARFLLGEAVE